MAAWARVERLTEIRHQETSLGNVFILYLDLDGDYVSVDIYQNLFNCTLKSMHLVCQYTSIELIQIKTIAWEQIKMQMVILEEIEGFRKKNPFYVMFD